MQSPERRPSGCRDARETIAGSTHGRQLSALAGARAWFGVGWRPEAEMVVVGFLLVACAEKTTIGPDTSADDTAGGDTGAADLVPYDGPEILINELMADHVADTTDPTQTGDWIELLNASTAPVSLDAYAINAKGTTDAADARSFATGVTLAPGEHLVVYGKQFQSETVRFDEKLNLDADTVTLYFADTTAGTLAEVDSVAWTTPIAAPNSFARTPDGGADWALDATPTPGEANE
jgi:hypothetical protein